MQEVGFSASHRKTGNQLLNPRRPMSLSPREQCSLSLEPQSSAASRIADVDKWLDQAWQLLHNLINTDVLNSLEILKFF